MKVHQQQAIILAGGRGERLRPYTDDRPKPMVEVNGTPLIAYVLGWLAQNGVISVVLSCGYHWEVLQSYLGDGARWTQPRTWPKSHANCKPDCLSHASCCQTDRGAHLAPIC